MTVFQNNTKEYTRRQTDRQTDIRTHAHTHTHTHAHAHTSTEYTNKKRSLLYYIQAETESLPTLCQDRKPLYIDRIKSKDFCST